MRARSSVYIAGPMRKFAATGYASLGRGKKPAAAPEPAQAPAK